MDPQNYFLAWAIYITAGLVFSVISWRVLSRYCWLELAFLLECWLLAIIFVPAQVMPEPPTLAPALIVLVMDTLTIGATAGIGALTRLVVGLGVGFLVAVLLSIIYRLFRRRKA